MAIPPVLARFEIQVLKTKSGDTVQIPALATIRFFRQGATTTGGVTVTVPYSDPEDPNPPLADLRILHVGTIQINDILQVETNTTQIISVVAVVTSGTNAPYLTVRNSWDPAGIAVASGNRLLRKTSNTIFYNDPTGRSTNPVPTDNVVTDSSTGRAGGYVRALRYDYTVTGTGFFTRLYIDASGSYVMRSGR
jgi:hypothetical protein